MADIPERSTGGLMANDLARIIGQLVSNNSNFALSQPGDMMTQILFGEGRVGIKITNVLVEERAVNDDFVLDHPLNGKLDYAHAVLGPSTIGAWTTVENIGLSDKMPVTGKQEICDWLANSETTYVPSVVSFGTSTATPTTGDKMLFYKTGQNSLPVIIATTDKKVSLAMTVNLLEGNGNTITEIGVEGQ